MMPLSRVENQLVRAGVDQQIGRLAIDADRHDHFVHRSVVHAHGFVAGQLHRGTIFGQRRKSRAGRRRKKQARSEPACFDGRALNRRCSVRCPQRISGHVRLCAEDSAPYSIGSVHKPVGQSINSHGTPNRFDKCAASALTPNTSVA